MTPRLTIHTRRRLRGVTVHSVSQKFGAPTERVEWLLDLHRKAEQAAADREQARQRLDKILGECEAAIASIPGIVKSKLDEVVAISTELGLSLAKAIVGEVVDQNLGDTPGTVLRCLEEAVPGVDVRVHLAPEDHAAVTASFAEFPELCARFPDATFIADGMLQHGCVRVESDFGATHYDPRLVIDEVCDEVRKELGA